MSQKLVTVLAFCALAIFIGTLAFSLPSKTGDDTSTDITDKTQEEPKANGGQTTTDKETMAVIKQLQAKQVELEKLIAQKSQASSDGTPTPAVVEGDVTQPTIEPILVDGSDIADILNLQMAKFRYSVPEGEYTVHLWVEQWSRNAKKPTRRLLLARSASMKTEDIVIMLPTDREPAGFLRVMNRKKLIASPLMREGSSSRQLPGLKEFEVGDEVTLISHAYNEASPPTGGLGKIHTKNDETYYVKVRITKGLGNKFEQTETPKPSGNAPLTAPD